MTVTAAHAGPLVSPRARRRAACVLALCAWALALCACEQGPPPRRALPLKSYERYLERRHRLAFQALETDAARRTFLAEHGAFIRHKLSEQLQTGMSMPQVETALGPPFERETEWAPTGELEWWTYPTQDQAFQTLLQFRAERLVSWEVIGGPE